MSLGFGTGVTGTNMFGSTPSTTTAATGLGGFSGFSFANAPAGSTQPTATPATGFSLTGALDASHGVQKVVRFDTGATSTQGLTVAPAAPLTLGSFATTSAAAPGGGFSFSTPTAATTAGTSMLSGLLGAPKPTLTLGAATTMPASTSSGFGFGAPTLGTVTTMPATTSSGFGFGAPTLGAATTTAATTSSGFGFGAPTLGAATTTAATTGSGFGFGASTLGGSLVTTTALGFGATPLGVATTAAIGLGGCFTSGATTTSSIFGATTGTTAVSQGLGGVDLKTASSASGGTGAGSSKTCDGRALKENPVDPIILNSIEEFIKHVKNQKGIRENIGRMSSKPLSKVKENMKTLHQQLMLVSNGLQKNSAAIASLKKETTQELKYAEMGHRTKDTPPGLQYENTAPTEFFSRLTEEFETQMMLYRQQIVDTENHLISLSQSAMLTPQELSQLFSKLNDGFVALAAQLQIIHEAVRNQKEQYLEYRKVYHGDAKDIFARRKKVQESIVKSIPSTVGPTPFSAPTGIGTLAQPARITLPQQTTAGSGMSGFSFGTSGPTQTAFGQTAQNTGSLFGTTATSGTGTTFGGTAAPATGLFGSTGASPFGSTGLTGAPTLNFTPTTTTAQAQKPFGSKRGKNA